MKKDPILDLSPHKLNKVTKLTRVRPEDFDVKRLMAAAREGRLYLDERRSIVSKKEVKQEVRAYVARIRMLATPRFCSQVDKLWEQILDSDEFMDFLMPGTKAKKCRMFNKYGVMRIIGVLRENGVYEQRSDPMFNALLEEAGKDSPYRRYLGQGLDQRSLLMSLRHIVESLTIW